MQLLKFVWILAIFSFIVLGCFDVLKESFVKVNPGQRAIKTQWGAIVDSTYAPGLVWCIPFTKDMGNDVFLVDIKPQRYEYSFNVRTKDLQKIALRCAILCEMNDKKVHLLYDKYQGYEAYQQKIIRDMVNRTMLTLSSFVDIWSFMGSEDKPIIETVQYIINDQMQNEDLMSVKNFSLLSYEASEEFEKLVEQTVQTKQGIKLEEYKAEMAKKATDRVLEEARQVYERMAAVARANGIEIQINAAAVRNNPFIAQYETAKALQKWNGQISLPQTLTIMKGANEKGGAFPLIPFMKIGK